MGQKNPQIFYLRVQRYKSFFNYKNLKSIFFYLSPLLVRLVSSCTPTLRRFMPLLVALGIIKTSFASALTCMIFPHLWGSGGFTLCFFVSVVCKVVD
jgi:hypothetical protein